MIKKIFSNVGEYKKYAILCPLIIIGEVLMELLIPTIMSKIIDNGVAEGNVSYIVKMGIIMVVFALLSLLFGVLAGRFSAIAGMGFAKNLRSKLFSKVQSFSFENIDKFSTASLITRLTTDVTNTQNAFMMVIRMAVRSPIMLVGAIIMVLNTSVKLSSVLLIILPILIIAIALILTNAYPRFSVMLNKYDKMNSKIQENLIGIRVVRAFVREKHEKKGFNESADNVRKAQVFAEKLVVLTMPIMQISMYLSIAGILFFGGKMVINEQLQIGELSKYITYVNMILMSLMMLSMLVMMIVISRASMQRIADVLSEESTIKDVEIVSGANNNGAEFSDGSISFRNVSFSYFSDMNNLALEKINMDIKSGETIGIIGGTGSSKTSLVQLIPRLYDVTEGEVIVGGHNVKDYKLNTLRNNVAMVLQKNVLFSGTIKDNLKWGDENATDEEIIEACKSACADDFIQSFPKGYENDLGQGGVNVSGGQKQRLCIARALLKKPKIIILDDSTSAVDTATDTSIRAAFKEKLSNTTTIIIAQRVASVKDADRIIVMDDGKINGIGTHDELLLNNNIYREVYESQQKGADE